MRVVQLALQPLFALRVLHHLLDELRHLALVLRREVVQRAARDERGGGRGRRGVGGNRPVLRAERRERGVDVLVESRGCRDQIPRRRTRGRGGGRRERGGGRGGGGRRARTAHLGLVCHRGRRGGEARLSGSRSGSPRPASERARTDRFPWHARSRRRGCRAPERDRASAERGRGAPRLLRRRDGRAGVRFRPPSHRDRGSGAVARRARAGRARLRVISSFPLSETTKRSSFARKRSESTLNMDSDSSRRFSTFGLFR